MEKTLFERILAGELPSHKVYEDAHTFAILDIAPRAVGHTLVIPKEPAKTFAALSEASAAALGVAVLRVSRALVAAFALEAYHVWQNNGALSGQEVPHVHVHIVPKREPNDGLIVLPHAAANSRGPAPALAAIRAQIVACFAQSAPNGAGR